MAALLLLALKVLALWTVAGLMVLAPFAALNYFFGDKGRE